MLQFDVVTLFPAMFDAVTELGVTRGGRMLSTVSLHARHRHTGHSWQFMQRLQHVVESFFTKNRFDFDH